MLFSASSTRPKPPRNSCWCETLTIRHFTPPFSLLHTQRETTLPPKEREIRWFASRPLLSPLAQSEYFLGQRNAAKQLYQSDAQSLQQRGNTCSRMRRCSGRIQRCLTGELRGGARRGETRIRRTAYFHVYPFCESTL